MNVAPSVAAGLTTNVAASFIARAWLILLQLIFAPVFLIALGADQYGLVTVHATLLATLLFLDQAVSPVLTRELARLGGNLTEARDTLRTLELISALTALALAVGMFALAPVLAEHWIHGGDMPSARVTGVLRLMGLAMACQWPSFLHVAGFVGLQAQHVATRLRVVMATIQWGGAALLLLLAPEPTIELFLAWQCVALVATSLILRAVLWRSLALPGHSPRFDATRVGALGRFASGAALVGLLGVVLTHGDKLLVAKYSSLDQVAGYGLCFLVASVLSALVAQPIGASLLPHLTVLMAPGHEARLASEYHRWTQVVALVALPVTGLLVAFPDAVVRAWLPATSPVAGLVALLVPWVALGTLFNVLCTMPYALQMAAGRTRLLVGKNIVAVAIVVPTLVLGLPRFGPIVGAWCWLGVNLGYYLFEAPLVHRTLLRGELGAWWLRDTLLPGIAVALVFGAAAALPRGGRGAELVLAGGTSALAAALLLLLLPHPRAMLAQGLRRLSGGGQS